MAPPAGDAPLKQRGRAGGSEASNGGGGARAGGDGAGVGGDGGAQPRSPSGGSREPAAQEVPTLRGRHSRRVAPTVSHLARAMQAAPSHNVQRHNSDDGIGASSSDSDDDYSRRGSFPLQSLKTRAAAKGDSSLSIFLPGAAGARIVEQLDDGGESESASSTHARSETAGESTLARGHSSERRPPVVGDATIAVANPDGAGPYISLEQREGRTVPSPALRRHGEEAHADDSDGGASEARVAVRRFEDYVLHNIIFETRQAAQLDKSEAARGGATSLAVLAPGGTGAEQNSSASTMGVNVENGSKPGMSAAEPDSPGAPLAKRRKGVQGCWAALHPQRLRAALRQCTPRGLWRWCYAATFSYGMRASVLLLALGGLMGCLDAFLLIMFRLLFRLRQVIFQAPSEYASQYALYVVVAGVYAGAAYVWAQLLNPASVGSGLPKMRAILLEHGHEQAPPRGVSRLRNYLGLRMLLAKAGGLLLVLASGMRVGREGPFVHMGSIIAVQMLRVPYFANQGGFSSYWAEFVFAAAAAVIGALYDAPVGGLLYTIEVLTTFSLRLSVYIKCFVTALVGAIVAWGFRGGNAMFTPDSEYFWSGFDTIAAALVLGVISGLMGGLWVRAVVAWGRVYKWLMRASGRPLGVGAALVVGVAVVTALVTFPLGDYMRASFNNALQCLIDATLNYGVLRAPDMQEQCSGPSGAGEYAIFFGVTFPFAAASVPLPVPAGLFFPVFTSGAAFGRLYQSLLQAMGIDTNTEPATYGVIGAAALAVSVTRSVSVTIIAMEMTSQLLPELPILTAVLAALFISDLVSPSIYDALAKEARISFLPILRLNWAAKHWRDSRVGELITRRPAPLQDIVSKRSNRSVAVASGTCEDTAGDTLAKGVRTTDPMRLGAQSLQPLDICHCVPFITARVACEDLERMLVVTNTKEYTDRRGAARLIPIVSDADGLYLLGGITRSRVKRLVEAYHSFERAPDAPADVPISHAMRRRRGLATAGATPGATLVEKASRARRSMSDPGRLTDSADESDANASIGQPGGAGENHNDGALPSSPEENDSDAGAQQRARGKWKAAFGLAHAEALARSSAASAESQHSNGITPAISTKARHSSVRRAASTGTSKLLNVVAQAVSQLGAEDSAPPALPRVTTRDKKAFAELAQEARAMDQRTKEDIGRVGAGIVAPRELDEVITSSPSSPTASLLGDGDANRADFGGSRESQPEYDASSSDTSQRRGAAGLVRRLVSRSHSTPIGPAGPSTSPPPAVGFEASTVVDHGGEHFFDAPESHPTESQQNGHGGRRGRGAFANDAARGGLEACEERPLLDLLELDALLHIIDHSPATIGEECLLSDAFLIFSSHTVGAEAFVTQRGCLVGALSRFDLYHATYKARERERAAAAAAAAAGMRREPSPRAHAGLATGKAESPSSPHRQPRGRHWQRQSRRPGSIAPAAP